MGVPIHSVDETERDALLGGLLRGEKGVHVATVNPEFLVRGAREARFGEILRQKTLNLCDGYGIVLLCRWLGLGQMHRHTGVTLAERVCALAAETGQGVWLVGGRGVAPTAQRWLQERQPNLRVLGAEDGAPDEVSAALRVARPAVVLVAMGAPKQAYYIRRLLREVPSVRLAMGVGGTFDFWAGRVPRAPAWMQDWGVEWLYRLLKQPRLRGRRIWRAVGVYPWLMLKWWWRAGREKI